MQLPEKDREGLLRALEFEETHPDLLARETYLGWTWEEVRVWPATLNRLIQQGYVRVNFHSNSSRNMALTEEGRALAQALREEEAAPQPAAPLPQAQEAAGPPPDLPADLFADIIGHDDVKELLRAALSAQRPVHVLLVGPPALAKSLFLWDLERAFGERALWTLGSGASRSGLWDDVAAARPRLLLVDELDKMDKADQGALLSLMEGGRIKRAKVGRKLDVALDCRVVAAANEAARLPAELLSRFARRRIQPYAPEEFRRVVSGVLVGHEGVDRGTAEEIAARLVHRTQDVRDAVRVARLAPQVGVARAVELLGL